MKTPRVSLVFLFAIGTLSRAQQPAATIAQPAPEVAVTGAGPENAAAAAIARRSAADLDQLLAPIALYPDALIAIILPASTASTDIVLAARYVRDNPNDKSQIENRAWDDSVKSLANYPEVLKWMDENLQWTKQIGEAFLVQPAEVMQSVQRLRGRARAAGTLTDTPQQQVIADPQAIRIVPAQPDVIYVPRYEPDVVFVDQPVYVSRPYLSFGVGVPVGSWLAFECDWGRNTIWVGNRHRPWTGHDWRRPVLPVAPVSVAYAHAPGVRQWRPPPHVRPPFSMGWSAPVPVARPAPLGSTFTRTYAPRPGFADDARRETPSLPFTRTFPRSTPPASSAELIGSRAPIAPVARTRAPIVTTPSPNIPAPAPASVVTAPTRRNGDWVRDHQTRAQPYRNPTAYAASAPNAPTLPTNAPVPAQTMMGPAVAPSYTHARVHAAPSSPAPASTYNYVAPAPATAYAAPRHVVAPPAAAPAAQPSQPAQSTPPERGGGGWRGGRRENQN